MKLRPLDFVAVFVAILAVVGVSVFAYGSDADPTGVSIRSDGGEFLYPLSETRVIEVDGPIGHTHVEIKGNRVRVTESPCRDKICVAAGWLANTGDWTACLPNRVFVRVEGGERRDGVDAQTF
ncbi:MAG: NusG domain II-containing protein [Spirochaetales bacterium]|nr:NusG domain II-containing protein [Spirochaetales bacterium]